MIANQIAYFTPEEYLDIESNSSIKHEYRQGLIYAMAGASKSHVIIAGNTYGLLRSHLQRSNCIAYTSDMKVRVEEANDFYYPDVSVTCDDRDKNSSEAFIRYPCLIIEVLSAKTEAFDRDGKFNDYKTLEGFTEYVLISQTRMKVECFRRNGEGNWIVQIDQEGDIVCFKSMNFSCPIEELYQQISLLH